MTDLGAWFATPFIKAGLVKSASEFRRLVREGGLYITDLAGTRPITPAECGVEIQR